MSQGVIQNNVPDRPPFKSHLASGAVAAWRIVFRWIDALDRILRGEATRPHVLRKQSIQIPLGGLSLLIVLLAVMYGFCMGMFPGCREQDASYLRWLSCTLKIPALFFLTLVVTFPSLYVVNALVGSQLRLPAVLRLLIAALAVNLAMLASSGPIVAFFSFSTSNGPFMVLLNVLVFGVAGLLGMKFLLQTLHRLSLIPPERPAAEAILPSMVPSAEGEAVVAALPASAPEAPDPPAFASGSFGRPASKPGDVGAEPSALEALDGHVLGRHVKTVFWCWTVIFGVVGAQMAWVLRPYFGNPGEPFVWFGPRTSNFFEGVWHAMRQLFQ